LPKTVARVQALLARLSSRAEPVVDRSEAVDLRGLIGDVISTSAIPPHIKLVTELTPIPSVLGDSEALRMVIHNLLTNAAQAIDGAGVITVSVTRHGTSAMMAVQDTGCGMSEQFLKESLFQPFRTTKSGGWGIGLYQVKEIVERHGGHVAVRSQQGVGTTVQITLPLPSV
jgi:signal transduction histidine kinase